MFSITFGSFKSSLQLVSFIEPVPVTFKVYFSLLFSISKFIFVLGVSIFNTKYLSKFL